MSGKRSQSKGRRGERELTEIFQSYGYNVRLGEPLNYGKEPDLSGLDGIHIECKRTEQIKIPAWMAQAERDSQRFQDGAPTIFFRRSREPWRVVMRLEDWINMYSKSRREE